MKTMILWMLAAILLVSCDTSPTAQGDDTPIPDAGQDATAEALNLPDPDFTVRAGEFTAYTLRQGSYEYRFDGELWAETMGEEQADGIAYTLRLSADEGTQLTLAFSDVPDGQDVSWPVFDYSPGLLGVTFAQATVVTEDGEALYTSNVREGLQGQVVLTRSGDVFDGEFDFTLSIAEETRGFNTEARFTGSFENIPLVE